MTINLQIKKWVILLIFLVQISLVNGTDWQFTSEYMEIDFNVSSSITITPEKDNYILENIEVLLHAFPRERFNQEVLNFYTSPPTNEINNSLIFSWENPVGKKFDFLVNGNLKINNKKVGVLKKISFPLNNLPEEVLIYTQNSEHIDSKNEEIIKLSSSLAEGEDDLFIVVFNVAKWVNENIQYSLNNFTEEISQNASWVLKNRYGVCDEISNLFIALIRSLGIPAKYVEGYAYTDWNNFNDFESHAWTEIYFPEYGWVAFDITYGEFGYIDVGHINLREGLSQEEDIINFKVQGRGIQISTGRLNTNFDLKTTGPNNEPSINLTTYPLETEVDFGSYNLIKVLIENLKNYYLVTEVYLSNTTHLDVLSENKKLILLKPKEKKEIYWIVKVDDNLSDGYSYTFPLNVNSKEGMVDVTNFVSEQGKIKLDLNYVQETSKEFEEESTKTYSREVDLRCDSREFSYINESIDVLCFIENKGNLYLNDLNVCVDDCKIIDLGIGQKEELKFVTKAEEMIKIKAQNEDILRTTRLNTTILDLPLLKIAGIKFTDKVKYNDIVSIDFEIERKSQSNPLNVKVGLDNIFEMYGVEEILHRQNFKIEFKGKELNEGHNNLNLTVYYEDKRGRQYILEENIIIYLEDINVFQRIMLNLNNFNRFIQSIFNE